MSNEYLKWNLLVPDDLDELEDYIDFLTRRTVIDDGYGCPELIAHGCWYVDGFLNSRKGTKLSRSDVQKLKRVEDKLDELLRLRELKWKSNDLKLWEEKESAIQSVLEEGRIDKRQRAELVSWLDEARDVIGKMRTELDTKVRCDACAHRIYVSGEGDACMEDLEMGPSCERFVENKLHVMRGSDISLVKKVLSEARDVPESQDKYREICLLLDSLEVLNRDVYEIERFEALK